MSTPPTYEELAKLVAELTEKNISNLDREIVHCKKCGSTNIRHGVNKAGRPVICCVGCDRVGGPKMFEKRTNRFVTCFTYGPGVVPDHWKRAIDARERLIENLIVERRKS